MSGSVAAGRAAATAEPLATSLREYLAFRQRTDQIPVLDGLRAMAVLLVLLRHAAHVGYGGDVPLGAIGGFDPGDFMLNGWIGVDLFFVLSGFLITDHILRLRARSDSRWTWGRYLAGRALRIVPAYYVVLALAVIGAFPGYEVTSERLGWRVAYHALFLQDVLPADIVVVFWSLGVEEKFYLIAPLLVSAAAGHASLRRRLRWPLVLLGFGLGVRVLLAYGLPHVDDYDTFFHIFRSPFAVSLDAILIGVAIAMIAQEPTRLQLLTSRSGARAMYWVGLAALGALLVPSELLGTIGWWDKTLQPLVIALAFGALTLGGLLGGGPAWASGGVAGRVVGRLSYALYLVHLPLVPLARSWTSTDGAAPDFATFIAAYLGLSFVFALALHYAVEKPFLLLKERIR